MAETKSKSLTLAVSRGRGVFSWCEVSVKQNGIVLEVTARHKAYSQRHGIAHLNTTLLFLKTGFPGCSILGWHLFSFQRLRDIIRYFLVFVVSVEKLAVILRKSVFTSHLKMASLFVVTRSSAVIYFGGGSVLFFPALVLQGFLFLWLDVFLRLWKILSHYLFRFCF